MYNTITYSCEVDRFCEYERGNPSSLGLLDMLKSVIAHYRNMEDPTFLSRFRCAYSCVGKVPGLTLFAPKSGASCAQSLGETSPWQPRAWSTGLFIRVELRRPSVVGRILLLLVTANLCDRVTGIHIVPRTHTHSPCSLGADCAETARRSCNPG